jgi:hypothetical protein
MCKSLKSGPQILNTSIGVSFVLIPSTLTGYFIPVISVG